MAKKSKVKLKVPKEVAGVKVPKGLRKQAKKMIEIIDSPAGRELAVAGLTLAASSLAAKASEGNAKGAVKAIAEGVSRSRRAAGDGADAADLGAILRAAAAEGARRFLAGFEEGQQAKSSGDTSPPAQAKPRPRARRATKSKPAG